MSKKPLREKANITTVLQDVLAAYQTCEVTAEDNVERLAAFGEKWNELKPMILAAGHEIGQYAKQNLPFSHQYANRCGVLAKQFDEFDDAYKWFKQSGPALGYDPPKSVGSADWALKLINYRRRDKAEKGPPQPSTSPRKSPRNEETTERLIAELDRVVTMLAATEERHGFESQVLNALKAERHAPQVADDLPPQSRADETDESNEEGKMDAIE